MAEGTGHAMPKGIKRVEKGVYRTLDGRHEIRQEGNVWEVTELASGQRVGEPWKNRGLAVQALAQAGKLPTEAPKPAEEMTAKELTEVKPELHPDAEKPQEQPKRRPTSRKPRTKAVAKV